MPSGAVRCSSLRLADRTCTARLAADLETILRAEDASLLGQPLAEALGALQLRRFVASGSTRFQIDSAEQATDSDACTYRYVTLLRAPLPVPINALQMCVRLEVPADAHFSCMLCVPTKKEQAGDAGTASFISSFGLQTAQQHLAHAAPNASGAAPMVVSLGC